MGECEGESYAEDDEQGSGFIEQCDEGLYNEYRAKEPCHDNHRLEKAAAAVLARQLGVEVERELIVYGQLHQHPEGESASEKETGQSAEERDLALRDGEYHDDEWNEEQGALYVVLGTQQVEDRLLAAHQSIEVVALVAHCLAQHHHAQHGKVVDSDEVAHESAVVYIGEG